MGHRRRLRSQSSRWRWKIAPSQAAAAWLCVGTAARVEGFCPHTSTAATQQQQRQQPRRLGLGGTHASVSPLFPRRESNHLDGTAAGAFVTSGSWRGSSSTLARTGGARRGRPSTRRAALSMAADVLSTLGNDALMFLAATVAVVPACKKLNIRWVTCQVQPGAGVRYGLQTQPVSSDKAAAETSLG